MKPTKSILILLSLFLISNCGDKVREEIIDRYDDGKKKTIMKFVGEGSEEVMVEKISYSQSGDTLMLEKPLDKLKMVREYYKNRQIRWEGNYKGGKEDDKIIYYNKDGSLLGEGIYKDGKKWNGLFVSYYENGKIKDEGNYKDGKKDGKWITYYENGKIKDEGNHKDDKMEGEWIFYFSNGELMFEVNYKDGYVVTK